MFARRSVVLSWNGEPVGRYRYTYQRNSTYVRSAPNSQPPETPDQRLAPLVERAPWTPAITNQTCLHTKHFSTALQHQHASLPHCTSSYRQQSKDYPEMTPFTSNGDLPSSLHMYSSAYPSSIRGSFVRLQSITMMALTTTTRHSTYTSVSCGTSH